MGWRSLVQPFVGWIISRNGRAGHLLVQLHATLYLTSLQYAHTSNNKHCLINKMFNQEDGPLRVINRKKCTVMAGCWCVITSLPCTSTCLQHNYHLWLCTWQAASASPPKRGRNMVKFFRMFKKKFLYCHSWVFKLHMIDYCMTF